MYLSKAPLICKVFSFKCFGDSRGIYSFKWTFWNVVANSSSPTRKVPDIKAIPGGEKNRSIQCILNCFSQTKCIKLDMIPDKELVLYSFQCVALLKLVFILRDLEVFASGYWQQDPDNIFSSTWNPLYRNYSYSYSSQAWCPWTG